MTKTSKVVKESVFRVQNRCHRDVLVFERNASGRKLQWKLHFVFNFRACFSHGNDFTTSHLFFWDVQVASMRFAQFQFLRFCLIRLRSSSKVIVFCWLLWWCGNWSVRRASFSLNESCWMSDLMKTVVSSAHLSQTFSQSWKNWPCFQCVALLRKNFRHAKWTGNQVEAFTLRCFLELPVELKFSFMESLVCQITCSLLFLQKILDLFLVRIRFCCRTYLT